MKNQSQLRYVVVSPMKNEEKYVAATLEAMASQTVPPVEWVIVNDGSTDRSAEIVAGYCEKYSWIRQLDVAGLGERLPEHYGGHVVDLIYDGIGALQTAEYDLIVKLDCDVSFEPTFFERILDTCRQNPRLGITSGVSWAVQEGVLKPEKSAPGHTLGATKVYRKKCFEDIDGLVRSMGWDGIDEIKARMTGWEAWPLTDLVVVHHRPEGLALGLMASGVERGNGSYFMGYHPIFMVARALRRMLRPGLAADGVGMLVGYFGSLFRGEPRIPDPGFIQFLRKNQLRKLFLLRSEI
ncbi:MAG: glycosyltransferase family A protein [Paludibaculum sp.]